MIFLNTKRRIMFENRNTISDFIKCNTYRDISFLLIYVQDNFNTNAFISDIDDIENTRCEIHMQKRSF